MNQKSVGIRIAPFVVGLLCFLLPFVQISCGGQKIASFTGVQLATGFEFTPPMGGKVEVVPGETMALVTLIALLAGLLFSLSRQRVMAIFAAMAGVVAIGSMIVLMIRWDAKISKDMAQGIGLSYDVGFWLVGLAAVAGIVLSYLRIKETE